ncbi:tellurite resistance/C4-dicarboxylate transporter family protein [Leekyejoonella antrihumi]|uniref:tellurite resistance/C4-dicarboxylate transporter family protein n=1 Tax=Leekyejoonella antrihumi TaxID=1660198 RepID=UPI0011B4DE88|nr:tellurite resistance/C4-dicarboxylate transporter family protein [Leekyejoonella antrihumi]
MNAASRSAPSVEAAGRPQSAAYRLIRDLSIAEFAFVMATGIISAGLWTIHADLISRILLVISVAAYVFLGAVHLMRIIWWLPRILSEIVGPNGFSFITFTAASNVLSARFSLADHTTTASILLVIGVTSWIVLGYGVPLGMIAHAKRHTTLDPVNGTWFIWIVGTQSVAVAAASLADAFHNYPLEAFAGICWAIGLIQYLLLAAVEFARLLLRRIRPSESIAPYWVFMGAAAITIFAGAHLLQLRQVEHLILPDVVESLSMIMWSFATWLIPLLLALCIWRTFKRHRQIEYRTEWWAIVFPVGMYGVASRELGLVNHEHWLIDLGSWDAWLALGVWTAVVLMLIVHEQHIRWARRIRRGVPDRPANGPSAA